MRPQRLIRSVLGRPELWVFVVSVVAYWDKEALHGTFVYDDAGSIRSNLVVSGKVPWTEVFYRDFWSTKMTDVQSHKSFRPITTLSFIFNYKFAQHVCTDGDKDPNFTYSFHIVNVILHGLVSALVTRVGILIFDDRRGETMTDNFWRSDNTLAPLVTGLLFALHPVHAEAVSNMTSRGELLMSIFFLLAFISYANNVAKNNDDASFWSQFTGVYVMPWLCMTLSLFCKEQGATALISAVLYEFLYKFDSILDLLRQLSRRDTTAISWFKRTLVLAIQTVIVCLYRYWLNGETKPDFIFDQNPAGFSQDWFTRVFSVNWVYCLYIRDLIYPQYLSPDWSGKSIDLITTWRDMRVVPVVGLWVVVASLLYIFIVGLPKTSSTKGKRAIRVISMSFWGCTFVPFLLSSNLLVVVGLMKADRVIYLPSLGFCLLEALLIQYCLTKQLTKSTLPNRTMRVVTYLSFFIQLHFYCAKLHERNIAWSSPLRLWLSAYQINPRSHHTIYNCGYELSLKKRYLEAEQVLRPIGDPHVDGPSNTFVYTMVLYNLDRCDESLYYTNLGLQVIDEKKQDTSNPRNTPAALARVESNLLVAKAFCLSKTDIPKAGHIMYQAVHVDPQNEYAVQQATQMVKLVEQYKKLALQG